MNIAYETKVRQHGKVHPRGIFGMKITIGRRIIGIAIKRSMKDQKWFWRKRRNYPLALERQFQIWRLMFGWYTKER